jgi:hypothetical protein
MRVNPGNFAGMPALTFSLAAAERLSWQALRLPHRPDSR